MSSVEIKNAFLSKPGPLKRLNAAKNRTTKFKDTLERFKQNQVLKTILAHTFLSLYASPLKPAHVAEICSTF